MPKFNLQEVPPRRYTHTNLKIEVVHVIRQQFRASRWRGLVDVGQLRAKLGSNEAEFPLIGGQKEGGGISIPLFGGAESDLLLGWQRRCLAVERVQLHVNVHRRVIVLIQRHAATRAQRDESEDKHWMKKETT